MCKIQGIKTRIENLDFTSKRGKMAVSFSDGRELIVPLNMFPDIKKLSVKDRNDWFIMDDQFFSFEKLTKIFSITDLLRS